MSLPVGAKPGMAFTLYVAGMRETTHLLYAAYQMQDDLMSPFRDLADAAHGGLKGMKSSLGALAPGHFIAGLEMLSRFKLTHTRPSFGITSVRSGNADVEVVEEVVLGMPFGNLLHFKKDTAVPQPRVLVIAPLSGHFSTLLAGTVRTLLADHDVYITDWANARDVPLSAGTFGVDDYIAYIIRFIEEIGTGTHILAVCQPCVQALAATAVMAEDHNPAAPLSMTLMAGPVDVRESPTKVNELAAKNSLGWFENMVVANVPLRFGGAARRVYPGFLQLLAFVSMNLERHQEQHRKLYGHLANNEIAEAEKIKTFYDEYFAVLDLPAEFYLETIDRIFHNADLANGQFTYRGQKVDPSCIRRTALLTVEGGRDDICGLGQTAAAHDLCTSLRPHLKRHHLQANSGHYGVFNGKRWEREIYPVVRNFILALE
jgi:poly(3-hydroxybutyrate) depolymerase